MKQQCLSGEYGADTHTQKSRRYEHFVSAVRSFRHSFVNHPQVVCRSSNMPVVAHDSSHANHLPNVRLPNIGGSNVHDLCLTVEIVIAGVLLFLTRPSSLVCVAWTRTGVYHLPKIRILAHGNFFNKPDHI